MFPLKDYEWVYTQWNESRCTVQRASVLFVKLATKARAKAAKCLGADGRKNAENPDDRFINALNDEYGPQAGFYFAFLSTYTTMTMPLAAASVVVLLLGYWLEWLNYLRLLGLLGMGTASIWCPAVVCRWRQRSNELLNVWNIRNTASAHELLQTNPNYIKGEQSRCSWSSFMLVLSIV
eukprot:COSAG02_NODE_18876_length_912_cov_20.031652_2_plen_178_part_01